MLGGITTALLFFVGGLGLEPGPCTMMDFIALEDAGHAPMDKVAAGLGCVMTRIASLDGAAMAQANAVAEGTKFAGGEDTRQRAMAIDRTLATVIRERPQIWTEFTVFPLVVARSQFGLGDYCNAISLYGDARGLLLERARGRNARRASGLMAMVDLFGRSGREACEAENPDGAAYSALNLYVVDREMFREHFPAN